MALKAAPVRQVVRPRAAEMTVATVRAKPMRNTSESIFQLQFRTNAVVSGMT